MIQKRYQYYNKEGLAWTPWFDYNKDDSFLKRLQKEEKYQLKCSNLLNEFKKIP